MLFKLTHKAKSIGSREFTADFNVLIIKWYNEGKKALEIVKLVNISATDAYYILRKPKSDNVLNKKCMYGCKLLIPKIQRIK